MSKFQRSKLAPKLQQHKPQMCRRRVQPNSFRADTTFERPTIFFFFQFLFNIAIFKNSPYFSSIFSPSSSRVHWKVPLNHSAQTLTRPPVFDLYARHQCSEDAALTDTPVVEPQGHASSQKVNEIQKWKIKTSWMAVRLLKWTEKNRNKRLGNQSDRPPLQPSDVSQLLPKSRAAVHSWHLSAISCRRAKFTPHNSKSEGQP